MGYTHGFQLPAANLFFRKFKAVWLWIYLVDFWFDDRFDILIWFLPSGNLLHNYWKWWFIVMETTNPLVNIQKAIENGPVEIVDLPIENGDFPVRYVSLPEGNVMWIVHGFFWQPDSYWFLVGTPSSDHLLAFFHFFRVAQGFGG